MNNINRIQIEKFCLFSILLLLMFFSGCYSYRYLAFTPNDVIIAEGKLSLCCEELYYDSLCNCWHPLIGDSKKYSNVAWGITLFYSYDSPIPRSYDLIADTLFVHIGDETPIITVPQFNNGLFDFVSGIGTMDFSNFKYEEAKSPAIKISTAIGIKDLKSGKVLRRIQIEATAKIKKGHGSELNK